MSNAQTRITVFTLVSVSPEDGMDALSSVTVHSTKDGAIAFFVEGWTEFLGEHSDDDEETQEQMATLSRAADQLREYGRCEMFGQIVDLDSTHLLP